MFPWFSHGFPMVFLWFSHGFPIQTVAFVPWISLGLRRRQLRPAAHGGTLRCPGGEMGEAAHDAGGHAVYARLIDDGSLGDVI